MRKLLSVCLLILCLSLPIFAGHSVIGGSRCSPCGPETGCICDPGEEPQGQLAAPGTPSKDTPIDVGSETLLILGLLLLVLRYKA